MHSAARRREAPRDAVAGARSGVEWTGCGHVRSRAVGRPASRRLASRSPSALGGTPTNRSPSSSNCSVSGGEGASSIGSLPDWVLGKAMTSRMLVWLARSAAQRSMPRAIPPCGGAPYSNASRTAPNFSRIPSRVWPCSRKLRSSRSRRWIRTEPPPSSQPLSTRSYCIARARPAGSSGEGLAGSPDAVTSSASSSGTHAAERVVRRVPALVLGVPLVHREAVDPGVREHVRVRQPEPLAELDAQPAEHVGGDHRRASATIRIRSPSVARRGVDDRALRRRRTGTSRSVH